MISFDEIARMLLQENGHEITESGTDEKAIEKEIELREGSRLYPVHIYTSDTFGEKSFEEFVPKDEKTDKTVL